MPEPRSAQEWVERCWDQGNADICAGKEPLTHSVTGGLCVDCARAYARQVGAQEREACAVITDGVPDPSGVDTGQIWVKTAASAIGRAIRARPDVEVP